MDTLDNDALQIFVKLDPSGRLTVPKEARRRFHYDEVKLRMKVTEKEIILTKVEK